jgi:FKBP-type peptidyl-prolyl cis-trans isomerase SlyD
MNIDNNCVVTMHLKITDEQKNLLHISDEAEPLVYLHGCGELIDGLEEAMQGKGASDEFDVTVAPEEGYGEDDPELIQILPIDEFNGIEMREGMELQGKDPEGNFRLLRVVKVEDGQVTVNMNHPLAGKILIFSVRITDVRAATEEEVEQGHVHTGDHEHH